MLSMKYIALSVVALYFLVAVMAMYMVYKESSCKPEIDKAVKEIRSGQLSTDDISDAIHNVIFVE